MRRRSREINIFNMSLLDILCGALGAFCFMMLALLPYYKPPAGTGNTQGEQQKVAETMRQLDEMKKNIPDAGAAEDMQKLVEELRAQIQQMQGQLNQALAAVEKLTGENMELARTNSELLRRNADLMAENERLKEMLRKMTTSEALAEMQKRIEQLEQQLQ